MQTEVSQNGIVSRLMDNPFAIAVFPLSIILVLLILGGACDPVPSETQTIYVSNSATDFDCEEVDNDDD